MQENKYSRKRRTSDCDIAGRIISADHYECNDGTAACTYRSHCYKIHALASMSRCVVWSRFCHANSARCVRADMMSRAGSGTTCSSHASLTQAGRIGRHATAVARRNNAAIQRRSHLSGILARRRTATIKRPPRHKRIYFSLDAAKRRRQEGMPHGRPTDVIMIMGLWP